MKRLFAIAWTFACAAPAATQTRPVEAPESASASDSASASASDSASDSEPEPDSEPAIAEPPAPAPAQIVPPGPRPFAFFRQLEGGRAQAFLGVVDGPPKKLPLVAGDMLSGTLAIGSASPLLSADGKWLALIGPKHDLLVAAVDGSAKFRLPGKRKGGYVSLLLSGFAPDSQTLLFHQDALGYDDLRPVPRGVIPGFHLLRLADMSIERIEAIDGFVAWMNDSTHVLTTGERENVLTKIGWEPQERIEILRAPDELSQVAFNGERMTYVRDVRQGWVQVVASRIDGHDVVAITGEREFAFAQWPKPSPSNEHVSYCEGHRDTTPDGGRTTRFSLHVVAIADPKQTRALGDADGCRYGWASDDSLLAIVGDELVRIAFDGTREVVADGVAALALAGDSG